MPSAPDPNGSLENLPGLDFRAEARRLGPPPVPIVDIHTHIGGSASARVYAEAAALYGVRLTFSQTVLAAAAGVRDALGDRVRFIAVPTWNAADRAHAWREGYLDAIRAFREEYDSRMIKLWNAPQLRDRFPGSAGDDLIAFDAPWRLNAVELAQRLGMMILVHVADPDTWFATKYADAAVYGSKASQYESLERLLDRFPGPFLAAHMGGWPENPDFLDGLLERHANLSLDTSATKWMVRELSKHPRERIHAFMGRWRGRILFGSDIVATDEHLSPSKTDPNHPRGKQADSPEAAFELYAGRLWALRTMFETNYSGASPIADGDLALVNPARHDARSSPTLRGFGLQDDILESVYVGAARGLLGRGVVG